MRPITTGRQIIHQGKRPRLSRRGRQAGPDLDGSHHVFSPAPRRGAVSQLKALVSSLR